MLYVVVPKGFFPTEDTGYIIGITEGATDISFPAISQLQRKVAEIVRTDPAVDYVNSTIGTGGPQLGRQQRTHVDRAEAAQRARQPADDHCSACAQTANVVPGLAIYFQPIQNINLGGKLAKSQYQYTLQSNDTDTLYRVTPEMREKISQHSWAAGRKDRPLCHQSAGIDRN